MSAFVDLLSEVYDGDPDAAAEAMMTSLKLSTRQREVLRAAIRHYVALALKDENKRLTAVAMGVADATTDPRTARKAYATKAASAPMPDYVPPREQFTLTLPELRAMLPVEFVLSGRRITWADATINDHRAAETARRTVARSHLVHADRHAQAIKALERSGCDSLGELFTRQAAA